MCKKFGKAFESLIIDQELAYKEVFNASVKHVQQHHRVMFMDMQQSVAIGVNALTTFMHFNEFCLISEDQTRLTAGLEQAQELVMACLGYDPDGDEDDDGDEDSGDDEGAESDEELEPSDPAEMEPLDVVEVPSAPSDTSTVKLA